MTILEENIYDQIDHVNNFKNDNYSDHFTERSVSTSDISQTSSENCYPNVMNDMKTITNQTVFNIQEQRGTIEIGDKYHFYTRNGFKCKMTILMIILLGMLMVMFLIWAESTDPSNPVTPPKNLPFVNSANYPNAENEGLNIVNRGDWNAHPFVADLRCLTNQPTKRIIVTQTGTEICTKNNNCKMLVKELQEHHFYTRNWNDIGYNFLIDAEGIIYEGLGWDQTCIEYKFDGICFAFIGTFNTNPPENKAIEALKKMILYGRKYLKLKEYKLYIHPRLQTTNKLYENIRSLTNFTKECDFESDNLSSEKNCDRAQTQPAV